MTNVLFDTYIDVRVLIYPKQVVQGARHSLDYV